MSFHPLSSEEATHPRKRKAPLDDNGEPITIEKKRAPVPRSPSKKQKTAPNAPPKLHKNSAHGKPSAKPAASSSMSTEHHLKKTTRAKSAEVEEIEDQEAFTHSATPKNPRNVVELSDGSDDEVDGEDA